MGVRSSSSNRLSIAWPIAAVAVTLWLRQTRLGRRILFPFIRLEDWIHELGHGLTAVLLGGRINKVLLYMDGSGQAISSGGLRGGKWGWVLVSAGGPLASSVVGLLLLFSARRFWTARAALGALGGLLLVSAALWIRTGFGLAYALLMGGALLALAWRASSKASAVAVMFLGVQLCFESAKEFAYIFSSHARVNGAPMSSDTAEMARMTGAPHLLVAVLMAGAAALLLAFAARAAYQGRDE